MKFAIITYILHKEHQNAFYSYGPYIREMNIWLNSSKEIIVVASKVRTLPNAIETPYLHNNISFRNIPAISFLNFKEILRSIIMFPGICIPIFKAMKEADHIHLRCPGNIGLIACFVQIFFPKKVKTVKYAGNWDPNAKQPWSYRLQKWILSNTFLTQNMTVLVYGDWSGQSKNILPFFTASFSESEIEKTEKDFRPAYKFLFVGNLVPGKQPLFAVQLVKALNEKYINAELHVYGEGEMMNALKEQSGSKEFIHLHGNQPLEVLKQAYKESHFLVLASKSEGWPKAVAEAMFFGCIPIVSGVSCVPWMLGNGSRGILIPGNEHRIEKREKRNVVESGDPPASGIRAGHAPSVRAGRSLPEPLGAGENSKDAEKKLLDTFQKNRQFECFPETAEAVSENVSRTGFSETPAYRQGRLEVTSGKNNERQHVLEITLERIITLIKDPEEMKRMSREAQEWSQGYTLEKFEAAIKDILKG